MYFSKFIASASALAMSVSAIPTSSADTRVVTLRGYASPNCTIPSLGELGVYSSQNGVCSSSISTIDPNTVSITFAPLIDGCVGYFYSDFDCTQGEQEVTVSGGCATGDAVYNSFIVTCD
ncbi:uncharacterized protein N7483_005212 [Penicillium malachiteum]|uniref:uncharacterized protein n=1 Tax=Penicillium malachiteum TaxID=1324776 RepID=UPI0025468476|nr:uncharacterized protein N7483_005212 [Penicillium malachiteum]KAJ5730704.1 hypothetical protein N7483_005212 [Penicillium malachiteum]